MEHGILFGLLLEIFSAEDLGTGWMDGILFTGRFNVGIYPGLKVLQVS